MSEFDSSFADDLERMIDDKSLADVLSALSEVCYAKAEHLRANWQDTQTATVWEKAATKLDALAITVNV